MNKAVLLDKRAIGELRGFDEKTQETFEALMMLLSEEGRLTLPDAKKIGKHLFEMRITGADAYRGMYAYVERGTIVVLRFFKK